MDSNNHENEVYKKIYKKVLKQFIKPCNLF